MASIPYSISPLETKPCSHVLHDSPSDALIKFSPLYRSIPLLPPWSTPSMMFLGLLYAVLSPYVLLRGFQLGPLIRWNSFNPAATSSAQFRSYPFIASCRLTLSTQLWEFLIRSYSFIMLPPPKFSPSPSTRAANS